MPRLTLSSDRYAQAGVAKDQVVPKIKGVAISNPEKAGRNVGRRAPTRS
jgi:hypothetical protein